MTSATGGRRYVLNHRVGQGAFGEVYLAEQESSAGFRRKVAIKILHASVESRSQDAGRRMRDEARILGRLSHRNIVGVLDLVQLEGRWAVVMDYVPGADLQEILEALRRSNEPFPGPAALEAGVSMLNALDAAHGATDDDEKPLCLVHRDIKPSNVRLTNDGEIKVLDFGVARVEMDAREAQTRSSGWIGTELYMSPERILIQGDTPAGDVYAAAATLVECILGKALGRTPVLEDEHTKLVDHTLSQCRPLLDGEPGALDTLLDLLAAALAADPLDRPTAREFADALEPLARSFHGESLSAFSRRFLPQIDTHLDRQLIPVEGTLCEDLSDQLPLERSSETMAEFGADSSLVFHGSPSEVTSSSESAISRQVLPWLSGAALLFFVGIGGLVCVFAVVLVWATANPELASVFLNEQAPDSAVESTQQTGPEHPTATPPATPAADVPSGSPDETEVQLDDEPSPAPSPEAPAKPQEATPEPATPPPEPSPEPTVTIRRALFSLPTASRLEVQCGEVSAVGTLQADLRSFPSGMCHVRADVAGQSYAASVDLQRACGVNCRIEQDQLTCTCS